MSGVRHAGIGPDSIHIDKIFPTPIARVDYPRSAEHDGVLRDAILDRAARDPGVQHSNEAGWQSADDFADWSGEAGAELIAFAKSLATALSAISHPENGLIEANIDWISNAWANVNRAGHGNAPHTHPGSYWSAVYWVDAGSDEGGARQGGDLDFQDPRGAAPVMLSPLLRMKIEGCLSAGLSHTVRPRAGTLIMFPSWLLHSVTRYSGSRPRISIAINLAPPFG